MLPLDPDTIDTESDVEQKFLYPLLKDVLSYTPNEIWSKQYLEPTEIDKGAGKKYGYYPDYLVCIAGIPCIVVEAKEPDVAAETGLREARLYALEINKRYPAGLNPIKIVLSSNGRKILFGDWDTEDNVNAIDIGQLVPGHEIYAKLLDKVSRKSIYLHVLEIRKKLTPVTRWRPLVLVGGPSRQAEALPPNSFSSDLVPLLRRYFDPDDTRESNEIIERGYCPSTEVTQYNAVVEALLKERVPHQESIATVTTTKNKADAFEGVLKKVVAEKRDNPDPMILLVGGVGSGKSIFIRRYFQYLISEPLKGLLMRVTIDFNKGTDSLEDVEAWICQQIVANLEEQFGSNFLGYDNLLRYFAPDVNKLERGPLALLKKNDTKEFDRQLSAHLLEWFNDPRRLAFSILRYYTKDKDLPFVVIFDNVDRRDRDQQLRIFQTVQWFRNQTRCFSILTLRDETYDAYRDTPPLDAFLKPFAFRITAPRFLNVIKKRLELAIEHLVTECPKKLHYQLENGTDIEYPATRLGEYLVSIYASIFHQSRQIRLVLEALSGRNTRHALEMFADILISGYLSDNKIFSITGGGKAFVPEWLVIRVLMRTRYRYYSSTHGYIVNILETDEGSPTANNFLLPEILEYLSKRRKDSAAFKIEGYQPVAAILFDLSRLGFTRADVLWALEYLLAKGLIIADHQRRQGILELDYVKISASGYFHLRFLATRGEYLSNIIIDTPLNSETVAKDTVRHIDDSRNNSTKRLELLRYYLATERTKFADTFPQVTKLSSVPEMLEDAVAYALQVAKGSGSKITHPTDGSLFED